MERCPCKQKSPEYPKCCHRASNHCDPEQMHPAHCCIVKLQNEHYCNSSASEHRQSHHSLELPELWQTVIDTLTAPTQGCSDHPRSWRQLWLREWIICGGKEGWLCAHSAVLTAADPEHCMNSSCNCSGDCR